MLYDNILLWVRKSECSRTLVLP